ncbi:MAG TPA: S1/P1 nuclease [Pyrinomonadaceae bacterium]
MPRLPLIAIFLAFLTLNAYSWDDIGHRITGYIAWQRMNPTARENVIKILRTAPEDSHLSAYYMSYGPKSDAVKRFEYFVFVPTWADVVRDRAFPVRYEKYHKSNWHYSDTFWRQVNGKVELITDKEPGGQGVVKLIEFDKAMRDAAAKDSDKAIALAWFLHVAGDLHQPLHTSGRHTEREPNGDQGGNFFLLTPEGTKREDQVNLHWFWDSIVGRNVPFLPFYNEGDYVRGIAESFMVRYPFDSQKGGLMLGDYPGWQKESFALANTDVFRADLKRFETPSDAYRRNAYAVSEQRLVTAGYRLGETLNEIFGKQ